MDSNNLRARNGNRAVTAPGACNFRLRWIHPGDPTSRSPDDTGAGIRSVVSVRLIQRSFCTQYRPVHRFSPPVLPQRSKYGDSFVTKNGNSSVTSTRTQYFSVKSVTRLVYENTTSSMVRVPLKGDERTSIAVSEKSL